MQKPYIKTMTYTFERRLLQIAVFVGGFVPVCAGLLGMIKGETMVGHLMDDISLDSHIRYLSGLLLGIGICFWSFIPKIESKTEAFRILTFIVFVGGLARLAALLLVGLPSISMTLAIVMELGVTPLLCLWQSRVAKGL